MTFPNARVYVDQRLGGAMVSRAVVVPVQYIGLVRIPVGMIGGSIST